jgi:hypothetical protein
MKLFRFNTLLSRVEGVIDVKSARRQNDTAKTAAHGNAEIRIRLCGS